MIRWGRAAEFNRLGEIGRKVMTALEQFQSNLVVSDEQVAYGWPKGEDEATATIRGRQSGMHKPQCSSEIPSGHCIQGKACMYCESQLQTSNCYSLKKPMILGMYDPASYSSISSVLRPFPIRTPKCSR
jgi:hypothetical protein